MPITAEPEILPPGVEPEGHSVRSRGGFGSIGRLRAAAGNRLFDDGHLDLLSHLLDDFIRIPGTPIRFGLDGIIGFIPGIGDILAGLASTIIVVAAWSRGVPNATLVRMVMNVAIETAVGSVPVAGNLFDIGWRANRRNYALLTKSLGRPQPSRRAVNWLLLAGLCLVLVGLMLVPLLVGGWLLLHLSHLLRAGGW